MFTEGYLASSGTTPIRRDLAEDAAWLTALVVGHLSGEPEPLGLPALMRLHLARSKARFTSAGELVLLQDQDRTLWDRSMIAEGIALIEQAAALGRPGPYQVEAAIVACHVEAATWAATDWRQIVLLGKKADLKPVHDTLMTAITSFGNDIELTPKKGYVSLRRKKQFAMIQPTTATRIDIGLILKNVPTTERLEAASSFNALVTHRVRVNTVTDVDEQLIAWLKRAYDLAG